MTSFRKILLGALGAALVATGAFAASPPASNTAAFPQPAVTTPNACTIAQTVVSTSSTSASLLAANANRKSLRFMVTGTSPVTVVPGTGTAVVGAGMVYAAATAANGQGGSEAIGDAAVAGNAFSVVSPAASSVTVWECS